MKNIKSEAFTAKALVATTAACENVKSKTIMTCFSADAAKLQRNHSVLLSLVLRFRFVHEVANPNPSSRIDCTVHASNAKRVQNCLCLFVEWCTQSRQSSKCPATRHPPCCGIDANASSASLKHSEIPWGSCWFTISQAAKQECAAKIWIYSNLWDLCNCSRQFSGSS